MPAEAFEWTVVVVGAWNRAILTPSGVARHLFGLEGEPVVQVELPLEYQGPIKISYGSLTVVPATDRIIVEMGDATYDNLGAACEIARRALEGLPETPVRAAGINLRYRTDE